MARASRDEISNFDESKELTLIAASGRTKHWPPVARVSTVQVEPGHAHEPAPGQRQVLGHVDQEAAREADAVLVEEEQEQPEPEPEPEGVQAEDESGQRPEVPVADQKAAEVPSPELPLEGGDD